MTPLTISAADLYRTATTCCLCHKPMGADGRDRTQLAHESCTRTTLVDCGIDPDADFQAWVASMEAHAQGIDSDYEAWAADQVPGQDVDF